MKKTIKTLTQLILSSSAVFLQSISAQASSFQECPKEHQHPALTDSLCAKISTPLHHKNEAQATAENSETISLFVRRFPARDQAHGSLWLIAGGPGESGASLYNLIETYRDAFPQLDIYIPDHRGTGASTTICKEEGINSQAGTALAGAEWGSCFGSMYANPDYVKAFSITKAANDLKLLIKNHGTKGKQYVYGVSYGTQLGLRLLQLDDIEIDGLILDSLVPLQDDTQYDLSQRSFVVNQIGHALLEKCQQKSSCHKGHDLIAIAKKLSQKFSSLESLDPKLKSLSLSNSLGMLLDIPHLRNDIPKILLALNNADAKPFLKTLNEAQSYYESFNKGYSNFGSSIPLVQVISAAENNLRLNISKQEIKAEEKELSFSSPLPTLMAEVSLPRYTQDQYFSKQPENLPKTLVLHGDMDPKTHYLGASKHKEKLRSYSPNSTITMITVREAPHFIAANAPSCFKQYASAFVNGGSLTDSKCTDKKSALSL